MVKLTQFFIQNRIAILFATLFLLLYGYYSLKKTPIDAIPDLSDVQVIIYSKWIGQVPQVIEDQLTYPLVTNMMGVPKVKTVRGYSVPNYSLVFIIFEDGTDLYWARSRVLEKLATIRGQLPREADIQLGPDATGVGWVYQYALVSKTRTLDELWALQNFYVKYALLAVPDVAEVASVGGYEKEYRVLIKPEKLYQYGLSLKDLYMALKKTNVEMGGKYVEINEREFLVRAVGYAQSREDLAKTVVAYRNGVPIRIEDLGKVVETPAYRMGVADYNGMGDTVGGIVVMRFGADAYKVIKNVKKKIEEIKKGLPEDVEIVPVYDRSTLIERAIDNLKTKLIEESIVVLAIVGIFLFHVQSAIVIIVFLIVSLLATFITMNHLGITSNIMSLGGIAIAIGTMVDAAIVLVENVHRRREEGDDLMTAITHSAKDVGKPIFLALLIVTVSFVPLFALEGQAGRLFKPLVATKTLSMLVAAIISVVVVPVLIYYLVRGRIPPEEKNPIVRFLIRVYDPLFHISVKLRYLMLLLFVVMGASTFYFYEKLGREFMPALNEGTILYMPTTVPSVSRQEIFRVINLQDRIIKQFPEVESVFGKAGRAETATDPAPFSMIETFITLKPEEEWRKVKEERFYSSWKIPEFFKNVLRKLFPEERTITYTELIREMDQAISIPGLSNMWTMPIKGRIDMITTGIQTPLGIKIYGDDINTLNELAQQIEQTLKDVDGIMSIFGERSTKATYIEIRPKREALQRYGLTISDINMAIAQLFANSPTSTMILGRERYGITLGVPLDYRYDLENLMIPLNNRLIPLSAVADIVRTESPISIKSENGLLTSYVFITPNPEVDMGTVIERAEKVLQEKLKLPKGYYYEWSGQFEYWKKALENLKVIIPVVILLIVLLVWFTFNKLFETILVLLTLPVATFGGVMLMYMLDYNISIASIAGFLALLGIAAEMGIVMVVYIQNSLLHTATRYGGKIQDRKEAFEAIYRGAVKRIRPIFMTFSAILLGLLPIMRGHGTGSEVMSRIAAPMVGGILSTFVIVLLFVPALYAIYMEWGTRRKGESS
ncbi:Cu(I)/Ag(I) efflux system membrane protein CusA/SilA [Hydrogenivirga caldilitoris]|uniref:Cu(I)/Ag(I) efflux system membrane protein CusA/SilA n=1 Tax=Hydrogenivirga caldilitoris TaxID=246264 RepID=A0A497XQA2_9AQUI|nr:efflux RND transporter permease subunit [Hydrogenivirga caldilitoris]RLJ70330.1 Cu(I)/Ag(I) efflux system membrane protein CusA/SilA [Hydrogenivirga caldilitoris]